MSVGTLQFMPQQLAHGLTPVPSAHCRALADLYLNFNDGFVAAQPEGGTLFRLECSDQVEHDLWVLDRLAIDGKQHIAGAHTGAIGRAFAHDTGDQSAVIVRQAKRFGKFRGDFLRFDADPATNVTAPFWIICSMMLRALETGMAKPMPFEPPVRE
jgi:hypothetical protein